MEGLYKEELEYILDVLVSEGYASNYDRAISDTMIRNPNS